jgi:hypothetical protein
VKSGKVEFWDDERTLGNSLIVTLKYGWSFSPTEHEGVRGFDKAKEAEAAVRQAVICGCNECEANVLKEPA